MIVPSLLLAAAPTVDALPSDSLRARLNRVAERCRLPRSAFKPDAQGRLHVRPRSSVGYRKLDCAFAGLKKEGVDAPLAIVGHEVGAPAVKP